MTCSAERLRDLNDASRQAGPAGPAKWMLTDGIVGQGDAFIELAISAVCAFDGFPEGNDPYGEHDFGSLKVAGCAILWKIDYYDRALEFADRFDAFPDPLNDRRVFGRRINELDIELEGLIGQQALRMRLALASLRIVSRRSVRRARLTT